MHIWNDEYEQNHGTIAILSNLCSSNRRRKRKEKHGIVVRVGRKDGNLM